MNLDEIQRHPDWFKLTAKQQQFLLSYLETGDKVQAAHAWNASNDATRRDMANRMLRKPAVRNLVDCYRGTRGSASSFPMSRRELTDLIASRLREQGLPTKQFVHLTDIFVSLRGWAASPTTPPNSPATTRESAPSLDALVLELERRSKE